MTDVRVLFIGGTPADAAAARGRLARHPLTCVDLAQAKQALERQRFDLVLVDAQVPPGALMPLGVPVVVVADAAEEALTSAWLDAGAADFVTRPSFLGLVPVLARLERAGEEQRKQTAREVRQRASTAALLSLAKSRVLAGTALEAAFRELLEAGAHVGETAIAGIWEFDRAAGAIKSLAVYDRRTGRWSSGTVLKFADFPSYFRALEELQQIVADDAQRDPHTAELKAAYLEPRHVGALLDTGIRIGGELKGILCLERAPPVTGWTSEELVFASALAEVAAVVFAGAERQRAQASEDRFRELFAHSRDAIVVYRVTPAGDLYAEDVNPAGCALMALPLEALIGRAPREVLPPETADLMMERHQQVLRSKEPVSYEHRLQFPTGAVWFNTELVPMFDAQGRVDRLAAIARDVTEQRTLEAQLEQSRTLQALGQLAGHIAHDFNNLLAGVAAWATRLGKHPDPEAREGGEQILQAAMRARELTRQVLTFGQREAPTRQRLNLTALVQEAIKLLEPTLTPGVRVHAELLADGTQMLGDAGQLHQVLLNLFANAVQAMDGKGTLTLRLDAVEVSAEFARAHPPLRAGHHLRLEVTDTGHGMSPQVLQRVFEPFFTTKEAGVGTGLGLSVVHGIVRAHDGALAVSSAVGAGTTFEVFFPQADRDADADATPGRGERVLLVDDQSNVARASALLLDQLGYRTTVFTDPREALAAFRQSPQGFDVVMTDLTMPQMSGTELATQVHAVRAELPIVVTTGRAVTEADQKALGLHAVLPKPWRATEAVQALRRVLAR